jgi:SSS family solute:Na+ symporter
MNPAASDRQLLRVGRATAVAGGVAGVLLSIVLETIIGALVIFYSLLVVTLFVPVLGGLYSRRPGRQEALAAIAAGVTTLLVVRFGFAQRSPWLDPTLAGLVAAALAFIAVLLIRRSRS